MKKTLLLLASFLMTCGIVAFAEETQKKTDFTVKATVLTEEKTAFKPGDKIPLKIVLTYPETHLAGAWDAVAYLRDVPEGFEKLPGFKIRTSKDPKWSSVETNQGRWFPTKSQKDKEFQMTLNTAGWPEGDYKLRIMITFKPLEKNGKFIYRHGYISFTLEN